ncbi:diiron oxygenase [Glycomyces paridis]|uniref:Diiron oxygenase n=1 Tax=Glycomyces paridis TaxID=2126555 RepID=A0A4S8P956_9ACTN|nr:diiron oxygenase [Glycomyces paridis]THV24504.1 diiron oxygenase [Glycomyces paridis]
MFAGRDPMPRIEAFRNWYERAGVRSEHRKLIDAEDDIHKAFFPEHLVPHLDHPLVDPGDPVLRRYLTAQHAFQWLRFTMHFEVAVVVRASQKIADGSSGLHLHETTRMDAYKIVVDEGYHSLYSLDVLHQLAGRSEIPALDYDFGPFIAGLDAVGEDFPQHRRLVELLQVVVFETLVTSILSDIPPDESVVTIMRETVREHAIDEGRHHAFFSAFFKHLWSQLDPPLRRRVAHYLPPLVLRSLRPATDPARDALLSAGFGPSKTADIIADSFSSDKVLAGIRHSAAKTLRLFEEVGVLDQPGARDAFTEQGLLLP